MRKLSVIKVFIYVCVLVFLSGCGSSVYYDTSTGEVISPTKGLKGDQQKEALEIKSETRASNELEMTVLDEGGKKVIYNKKRELLFLLINETRFDLDAYIYDQDEKELKKYFLPKRASKNEPTQVRAWVPWDCRKVYIVYKNTKGKEKKPQEEKIFLNAYDCNYDTPCHGYSRAPQF